MKPSRNRRVRSDDCDFLWLVQRIVARSFRHSNRLRLGINPAALTLETKHGLSQLHAASVSNQPYNHADALKYAIYQTKTPDTFVCSQYMTRCPFSLSRLVKVSDTGQVIYQSEKQACRAFPDPKGDGMRAGVPRNFQILEPLDFLAEFTQHIPAKGSHLIRYYGWYSNKSRGMRKKAAAVASAEAPADPPHEEAASQRSSQAWAMLIKRIYEVDPLSCPECGGQMKVVSFIEPPQTAVIEAILTRCGLWESRSPRAPPEVHELVLELDPAYSANALDAPNEADESQELTYVDIDNFLENY